MTKERPTIFSAPMVRAILEGRKTQARRVMTHEWTHGFESRSKLLPLSGMDDFVTFSKPYSKICGEPVWLYSWGNCRWLRCPYGVPGDRLWVRETWGLCSPTDETLWFKGSLGGRTLDEMCLEWEIRYRSTYGSNQEAAHWRPSIFMPRWASRILLEITDVRVQHLQDISDVDIEAEGVQPADGWLQFAHRKAWVDLWESIHGAGSWDANPLVWAVSFKRLQP